MLSHINTTIRESRSAECLLNTAVARHFDQLSGEVYQVAQALILCGLPYRPTSATRITRKAFLANGRTVSVTFSTALDSPMPYGSDRSLLHFILDRSVKTKSRFVSWETASEFLDAMKMAPGGKNRRDLRDRFDRIRGLTIGVVRHSIDGDETEITPVIRRSHLPTSVDRKAEKRGQRALRLDDEVVYGVEIDEAFFTDLMRHHVPIPEEILHSTRRQSQLQDLMLFLFWRCYAAQSESMIPWEYLLQQLWQDDSNRRRIRSRFESAIRKLRCIWPEIQVSAAKYGLTVAPPRNGQYLTSQATAVRRLS